MTKEAGNNRELTQSEHDAIRNYLLDELSDHEIEQVERQLLTDAGYFEQFLIAEDDLIDAYVSNQLNDHERKKFSRHFLSVPGLRQDVRFASALHQRAAEHERRTASLAVVQSLPPRRKSMLVSFFENPAIGLAMAAALLLAVCLGLWLAAQNRGLRAQVEHLKTQPGPTGQGAILEQQLAQERERARSLDAQLRLTQEERVQAEQKLNDALKQLNQQTPRPESNSFVPAFLLTIGGDRDSGEQLKIPRPTTSKVNLQMEIAPGDFSTYSAELKTIEGRTLLTQKTLPFTTSAKGTLISLIINTKLLTPGDYRVVLSGKGPDTSKVIGSYSFRVSR